MLLKNQSILCILRDRESNRVSPYRSSLKIIRQLLLSKNSNFKSTWKIQSAKPVQYEDGFIYCNDYSLCYTLYGKNCQPSLLYKQNDSGKVSDALMYSSHPPTEERCAVCTCGMHPCFCLSKFLVMLTRDEWLCQYNAHTGRMMKKVYVKHVGSNLRFKYCDWNVYGETIILTSALNLCKKSLNFDSDIVVELAVFDIFPLEFRALFEVRQSVFGSTCRHVNISDDQFILGMGNNCVHIYNFPDVLTEGTLIPYKLGDSYNSKGGVGFYPTGLPLNFKINSAPPLLFEVRCFGQTFSFGGYPYHCMFLQPKDQFLITLRSVTGCTTMNVRNSAWDDEPNAAFFHPNSSNRIIIKNLDNVSIYKLHSEGDLLLENKLVMGHEVSPREIPNLRTSFGRRVKQRVFSSTLSRSVLAFDYEDELDVIGVLFLDAHSLGFIKLFDNASGEEMKTVSMPTLGETCYYQLSINLDYIVVIEKNEKSIYSAQVFQLSSIQS